MANQEAIEQNVKLPHERFLSNVNLPLQNLIVSAAVLLLLANFKGSGDAQNQKKFLVPRERPDFVVAGKSGDQIVLVGFDAKTKTLNSEIAFIDPKSVDFKSLAVFDLKSVGPLEPAVKATPSKSKKKPLPTQLQKTPPPQSPSNAQ